MYCCCCLPTAGQATGTAANMLALATVTPPYGVVYSPAGSHAASDECNAPESAMSGAKFIAVPSPDGKVDPASLDEMITNNLEASEKYFHSLPTTISITNVTEAGTVYSAAETAAIGAVSKKHGLVLHLDGARFGNAVAAAGCSPAELTWKAGVDVMDQSFGCTKNGAMAAEAVVFFNRSRVGTASPTNVMQIPVVAAAGLWWLQYSSLYSMLLAAALSDGGLRSVD